MNCQNCGEMICSTGISRKQKEDIEGEVFVSVTGVCESCGSYTMNDYTDIGVWISDQIGLVDTENKLDYDHIKSNSNREGSIL